MEKNTMYQKPHSETFNPCPQNTWPFPLFLSRNYTKRELAPSSYIWRSDFNCEGKWLIFYFLFYFNCLLTSSRYNMFFQVLRDGNMIIELYVTTK